MSDKVYIVVDESYDKFVNGFYLLSVLVFKSKKDLRQICKKFNAQVDILFADSKKHTYLQMADLFAGEIRRGLAGKVAIQGLLKKSKNLQE